VKNAFKTYESKIQLHSCIANKNLTFSHMGKRGEHFQQETLTIHIRRLITVYCWKQYFFRKTKQQHKMFSWNTFPESHMKHPVHSKRQKHNGLNT